MSTAPSRRSSGRGTAMIGTSGSRRASSIGSSFDNRGIKVPERAIIQQRSIYNDTLTTIAGENRNDSKDVPYVSNINTRRSSAFPNSKILVGTLSSATNSLASSFVRLPTQKASSPLPQVEERSSQKEIENFPHSTPHLSGEYPSRSSGSRTSSLNLSTSKEVTFVQKRTRPSLPSVVPSFFNFRRNKTSKTTSISSQSTHEEDEESPSMLQRMEQNTRGLSTDRKVTSAAHSSSYSLSPSAVLTPSLLRKSETAPYSVSPGMSPALSSKVFSEGSYQFFPGSTSSFKQSMGSPNSYLDVPRATSPSNMHVQHSPQPTKSPLGMSKSSFRFGEDGHSHNVSLNSSPSDKLQCQKSFESHDSTTSAMSMSSATPEDHETVFNDDRRLRRARTESRKHQKRSQTTDESSSGSSQFPSSSHSQEPLHRQMLSAWKKAIGSIKGTQKAKPEVVKTSFSPPPVRETDDSTDALYQFLRCRQCSKGEKCNDANCPGRDPNKLPTITKRDLGAEQRRALLKKANPRLHSLDAPQ